MIRTFKTAMALAAAIVLMVRPDADAQRPRPCPSVVIDLSTGVDANGNILPVGTPDPKWQNNQGTGDVTGVYPGWSTLTGSTWLGVTSGASATNYVYTLNFSNAAAGTMNFTALADNYVTILLDGNPIAQTPGGPSIYGFQLAYATTFSGGVSAGSHTLTATVYNQSGPTGFNLSGNVSYTLTSVTQDLSTGVNGVILPVGTQDPNWNGPANFVDYNGAWNTLTGSTWIGNASYYAPGTYSYSRIFYIPNGGVLNLEALADNYVEVYLDGNPITQTPGLSPWGFQLANLATYSAGITAGWHTLTADVTNLGGPMGLNVHASVTYCDVPPVRDCSADPTFWGQYQGGLTGQFISNQVPLTNSIVTHYWDFGDGNTSHMANPVHSYASAGSYVIHHEILVQILDSRGNIIAECKAAKDCKLSIDDRTDREHAFILDCGRRGILSKGTGITPILTETFGIAPNPAQNELKIRSNSTSYQLQIVSIDGKVVVNNTTYTGAENTIDISKLAYGTYIAVINDGGTMKHFRFVKVQ